jgi:hypothetical protein
MRTEKRRRSSPWAPPVFGTGNTFSLRWKQKLSTGLPLLPVSHARQVSPPRRLFVSFPNSNQKRNNSMEGGPLSGGEGKKAAVMTEVIRPKPNFADRIFKFCMVSSLPLILLAEYSLGFGACRPPVSSQPASDPDLLRVPPVPA